jgi:hypothetical protein
MITIAHIYIPFKNTLEVVENMPGAIYVEPADNICFENKYVHSKVVLLVKRV